ncbi:hypothetical protein OCAR_6279 [Afipia carboxidovorans OM5]|nr:hypothetical protein OCAR_6279 [Afipia carboxidovorans OM5]
MTGKSAAWADPAKVTAMSAASAVCFIKNPKEMDGLDGPSKRTPLVSRTVWGRHFGA